MKQVLVLLLCLRLCVVMGGKRKRAASFSPGFSRHDSQAAASHSVPFHTLLRDINK